MISRFILLYCVFRMQLKCLVNELNNTDFIKLSIKANDLVILEECVYWQLRRIRNLHVSVKMLTYIHIINTKYNYLHFKEFSKVLILCSSYHH